MKKIYDFVLSQTTYGVDPKLYDFYFYYRIKHVDLPVTVFKTINCSLGNKQRIINIQSSTAESKPTFKKDGNSIIYLVPTDFAILENGVSQIKY